MKAPERRPGVSGTGSSSSFATSAAQAGLERESALRSVPEMQKLVCSRRASASRISWRWRPRPPVPIGAEHETATAPSGIADSCARATCCRHVARFSPRPCPPNADGLVETVITPQAEEVAPETFARSDHLGPVPITQQTHHGLIRRARRREERLSLERAQRPPTRPFGRDALDRLLHRMREGPATDADGVD